MKVRVSYTVEVDPATWRAEFGLPVSHRHAAVRDDVRKYAEHAMHEYIASLGLERPMVEHWSDAQLERAAGIES